MWFCQASDCILNRSGAERGQVGYDALGATLNPSELATIELEAGPNVRVEGSVYVAQVRGVVSFVPPRIDMLRMLILRQDLTNRDAPIDLDGQVKVQATGHITVDGPVEAAFIESTGGDVELGRGAVGHDRGVVRAAGRITTRFAEKMTLYAGSEIDVGLGCLHSHLIAATAIHLVRGRGQFIGGSAVVGELVRVKQLGSSSGVPMQVIVDLSMDLMERLGQIDSAVAVARRRHVQASDLTDRIERAIGDPKTLTADEFKTFTALRQCQLVVERELSDLARQRQELLAETVENRSGQVEVLDSIMPGVTVRIGNGVLENRTQRRRCRITYDTASATPVIN